jgi:hypothetical protein
MNPNVLLVAERQRELARHRDERTLAPRRSLAVPLPAITLPVWLRRPATSAACCECR